MKRRYLVVRGQCDEACLELHFDPVPKKIVFTVLQRIGRKPITYETVLPNKKRVFLPERRVKYVEDIIVKRDTSNLGISRKEVIQVISYIRQTKSFVQAENHLDYLMQVKWLTHLKSQGRLVKAQTTTTKRSHICVSRHYRWHVMIEAEWEDLWWKKQPRDIFYLL